MKIQFSRVFYKQYRKADKRIKSSFEKKIEIFMKDPFNSQLNNHKLSGKFKQYRSINITGDWRAIYSVKTNESENIIMFEVLGSHSELY